MWRKQLMLAVLGMLAVPATAQAGVLGKVVGGIHDAADSDGDSGSSGGGSDDDDDSSSSSSGSSGSSSSSSGDSHCCWSSSSPGSDGGEPFVTFVGSSSPGTSKPAVLDAYLGIQSVKDSNGSMTVELRASYDDFAIIGHDTSFWEEPGPGAKQMTRLDLWALGAAYRFVHHDDTTLWGEAVFAGVQTVPDLQVFGAALGIQVDHHLGGEIGVSATAREYLMEHDISATELQVALKIAVLRVSYRVVDFNVGPPLMGPEVGVSMRF